jgi:hypothetical protein
MRVTYGRRGRWESGIVDEGFRGAGILRKLTQQA